jgi:hypothetical protein
MENYPKFEKVNDYTIRIIMEKADEVPLSKLIESKKQIEEKLIQLNQTLNSINDILGNAEKLGIVPEEKNKDVEK